MGGSASWSSNWWPAMVTSPPIGTMAKLKKAGMMVR